MNIPAQSLLSVSEANRNFSEVTKRVDTYGCAVILKNNSPHYVVIDFEALNSSTAANDEDVLTLAQKLMTQDAPVYKALAQ